MIFVVVLPSTSPRQLQPHLKVPHFCVISYFFCFFLFQKIQSYGWSGPKNRRRGYGQADKQKSGQAEEQTGAEAETPLLCCTSFNSPIRLRLCILGGGIDVSPGLGVVFAPSSRMCLFGSISCRKRYSVASALSSCIPNSTLVLAVCILLCIAFASASASALHLHLHLHCSWINSQKSPAFSLQILHRNKKYALFCISNSGLCS